MHLACMIDRILKKEYITDIPDYAKTLIADHAEEFNALMGILNRYLNAIDCRIPRAEAYYLYVLYHENMKSTHESGRS